MIIDRWVNKSLSVRGVKVYLDDKDKDEPDLEWAYWAANYSNDECMRLVPLARLRVRRGYREYCW